MEDISIVENFRNLLSDEVDWLVNHSRPPTFEDDQLLQVRFRLGST